MGETPAGEAAKKNMTEVDVEAAREVEVAKEVKEVTAEEGVASVEEETAWMTAEIFNAPRMVETMTAVQATD